MENVADIYPLTPVQFGILTHCLRAADASLYHSQVTFHLKGVTDEARIDRAWRNILACHGALRTFFLWEDLDEPVQVIHESVEATLDTADWSVYPPADQQRMWVALCEDEMALPFELDSAPLTRLVVRRVTHEQFFVLWSYHHLLLDGWASLKLLQDFLRVLTGEPVFERRPFRDFVAWRLAQSPERARAHWGPQLEGFSEPARLSWRRPVTSSESATEFAERVVQRPGLVNAIADATRLHRVTAATLVHGAWALLLSRVGRTADVLFGTTVAGRPPAMTGVDEMIGLFVNTIPLRIRVSGAQPVGAWLRELHETQVRNLPFEHASLSDLQKLSALEANQALFDSVVVSHNFPSAYGVQGHKSISIDALEYSEHSHFPLALLWSTDDNFIAKLVFRTDVLSTDEVEALVESFLACLEQLVSRTPYEKLNSIALAGHEPASFAAKIAFEGDVTTAIRRVCAALPDAPALVHGDRTLSYGELETASARLANALQAARATSRIGILVTDPCDYVCAIVAILRSGGCYVPLNPQWPLARLREIVIAAEINGVIVDSGVQFELDIPSFDAAEGGTHHGGPWQVPHQDDLAYILFTSGSTGEPKGVPVTHGNLAYSTHARCQYYGVPPAAFLLLSEFTFDSSVAGLFWSLTNGSTLVLTEPNERRDPEAIARLINRRGVTDTLCIPALYQSFLDLTAAVDMPSLARVIVAGESVPPDLVNLHLRNRPEVELYNEYGPTEASVWCSVARLGESSQSDAIVPIGSPPEGTQIQICDAEGRAMPRGLAGELVVSGPGVTRGYVGSVSDAFSTTSEGVRCYRTGDLGYVGEDGQLRYLGRVDRQLKIRGQRIEPQEIERAIGSLDCVGEVVVTAAPRGATRDPVLVAYCVADGYPLNDAQMSSALRRQLAPVMLPQHFVWMTELPRNAHGKVAIAQLPKPVWETGTVVKAANHLEQTLLDLWAQALGLPANGVSVDDDFFALGGDSILGLKLVVEARRAGVALQPNDLFANPTVRQLAQSAAALDAKPAGSLTINADHSSLLPIARWFFAQTLIHPERWNMSLVIALDSSIDDQALKTAWERVHQTFPSLRSCYARNNDSWASTGIAEHPLAWRVIDVPDTAREPTAELLDELQSCIDLERGELFKGFMVRANTQRWLVLVAHHLAVDGVSWRYLLDEASRAYDSRGEYSPLAETITASQWAGLLAANATIFESESQYWSDTVARTETLDKVGNASVRSLEAEALDACVRLPRHQLDDLMACLEVYGINFEELLLAGLALAWADVGTAGDIALTLEAHGRANPLGVDLSSTVGWLTCTFPFVLPGSSGCEAAIVAAKEARRAVPSNGLGFGVLRDAGGANWTLPRTAFNYLGRFDENCLFGKLLPPEVSLKGARHPDQPRPYELEINAEISGGELIVRWTYSPESFDEASILRLGDAYIAALARLAEHCKHLSERQYSPADFSASGLDQKALDQLLDELD